MEIRRGSAPGAEEAEQNADVVAMLRTCDAVLGTLSIALASLASWFAFTRETQPWVAALAWSIPILNIGWSHVSRGLPRTRADAVRTIVFLPVAAALYGGASGPLEHVWLSALFVPIGMAVVNGVATRSARTGYVTTTFYCCALALGATLAGQPMSFAIIEDMLAVAVPGFTVSLVASKLGRSLADARSRRADAEASRAESESALRQLAEEARRNAEMETELRLAQKLQAVGQLASGIGHEINTPIQYVSDNVSFLRGSFARVDGLRRQALARLEQDALRTGDRAAYEELVELERRGRMGFLEDAIPEAFDAAVDGLDRITEIVRALKMFAHHGDERSAVDLGQLLTATLQVARGEYKLVADVETELEELPTVVCSSGEIGQVLLNLVVNASHAIADVVGSSGDRGLIRATTRQIGDEAEIAISDTGAGVPTEIRDRIFEPFFTTKDVGKGSGQGLAIARAIVDRHGGSLSLESSSAGTTFFVRLPIAA